ncbi:monovalent cation/H+ antiporter complex subunit F [Puniceicoccaceae bacterium K14]|nr:monovalent cation/H+ antiporter complex subunit F [Puniceicoccaceae bacterium K14]
MYSELQSSATIGQAISLSYAILAAALVMALIRLIKGPTLADRAIALDLVAGIALSIITLIAIEVKDSVYLNVALCISIVAFLGTIAFVKFLEAKPK